MYGGIDADFKTAGYDDLYVLTIPAFVWIKMWPRVTPYPSMAAHSLSCDVINGTQMILMGGYRPTTKDCDAPNFYGQHGVDLGQINEDGVIWAPFSHENPPYRVPPRVVDIIGGT